MIRDYLRGRLTDPRRLEFKEHLLSCEYCKRDIGDEIARSMTEDQIEPRKTDNQRYMLYFVLFILLVFLVVVSIQYMRLREYQVGEMNPVSEEQSLRLRESVNKNKELVNRNEDNKGAVAKSNDEEEKENSEDSNVEDFSAYTRSELLSRVEECRKQNDYHCISSASIQLVKKSTDNERRKYRLMAIEALVEMESCSAAMLNIMMLFKENPEIKEIHRAHFLNAKCYFKEKNFSEARKILNMIEKDATELKEDIKQLKTEIEKGEEDGRKAKPEGIQD